MSIIFQKIMLEEIGQIVTGKTPSSNVIGAFSSSGIPFVTPKDMDGRRWIETTERYLSEAGRQSLKNYLIPKDSVAVSCIGSDMGKAILLKKDSVTNQQINTIIVDASKHNPKYIYYVLSLKQEELKSIAGGSATPILNKGHFSKVVIELPDKVDQDNIVQVLDSLDCKIELNNQINQNLESMAQAMFKSWFIDFDPVRAKNQAKQEGKDPELAAMCAISGKSEVELQQMAEDDLAELRATASLFPDELVESELGEVPKGWEVKRFEDLLDTLESGTRPKGGVSGISEGIPSVGAENILGLGIYNYGKEKFVPYSFFEKMKKGKVQDYDVLLYKDGGKPGEFKPRVSMFGKGFPYEEFSINEHVFRIRSTKLEQFFLYFKIKSPDILSQLASKGAKAAIPGINQNDVKSLYISCPTDNILEKFNSSVESLINLILKNSLESKSLAKLRDSLLPKLLSGEVEVENL